MIINNLYFQQCLNQNISQLLHQIIRRTIIPSICYSKSYYIYNYLHIYELFKLKPKVHRVEIKFATVIFEPREI